MQEVGDSAHGGDGRGASMALGIDLGGTKVLSALVDERGRLVSSHRMATDAGRGFKAVAADIVECARSCLAEAGSEHAVAAGIGVAGQVERGTGVVRYAPNLDWTQAPLRAAVEESLGLPVVVLNDVRAAAWAEWRFGAGVGKDDVAVIYVGTGVGGALISAGRMQEGCGNTAGELGHMILVAGGRRCHCGNHGCLEAYVGGWAIAERVRAAVAGDPRGGAVLTELAGGLERVTASHVTEAARLGDRLAREQVAETREYLAAAVTGIVNAFNPCVVILGGGILDRAPEYLHGVREQVIERVLPSAADGLEVVPARLGATAGAIGAAAAALSQFSHAGTKERLQCQN